MLNEINNLFCAGPHVQTMIMGVGKEGRVFQKGRKSYLNEEGSAGAWKSLCKHQEGLIAESSLQLPPELWINYIPWEMLRLCNVKSWPGKGWCLGMLV